MTIEKVMGGFTGYDITCDECEDTEYLDVGWDEPFGEVLLAAKDYGYKSRKTDDGWEHICSTCQEEG